MWRYHVDVDCVLHVSLFFSANGNLSMNWRTYVQWCECISCRCVEASWMKINEWIQTGIATKKPFVAGSFQLNDIEPTTLDQKPTKKTKRKLLFA